MSGRIKRVSEAIQVALIAGGANIIAVLLSRLHSQREHKGTNGTVQSTDQTVKENAIDIKEIKRIVTNGQVLREYEGRMEE